MSRPAFTGAVDCHAHILGPFDRFPLTARRSYTPTPALLDDYLAMLAKLGLERAVIVQASVYGSDNECTIDAVRRLGPRGRGIAAVDAHASEAELTRLKAAGIVGLRINHLQFGAATPHALAPHIDLAKRHGFHLQLFQTPAVWPALLPSLLESGVDWVVDHFGMVPAVEGVAHPGFQALLHALRQGGWIKLSGFYRVSQRPGYSDVRPMVDALVEAAPTRCVWGSDWPHTDVAVRPDTEALLALLAEWLSPGQLERVLVHNPARLYWG
jgi:2-pyrone-4,6-dicarboxylate lactonase